MKKFVLAAVALVSVGTVAANASTYDLNLGVGGPSPFYYSAGFGVTPDPLVYTGQLTSSLAYFSNSSPYPQEAYVVQNFTNTVGTYNTLQIHGNSLSLDPQSVSYVAVNFMAPSAGAYSVNGTFLRC